MTRVIKISTVLLLIIMFIVASFAAIFFYNKARNKDEKIGQSLYTQEHYNFSVNLPTTLVVTPHDESSDSFTYVFEDKSSGLVFQLFVTPYLLHTVARKRLERDMPSLVFNNLRKDYLGGIDGITFYGRTNGIGETFELWVQHNDYLYEITAPKESEEDVRSIISSWKFLR